MRGLLFPQHVNNFLIAEHFCDTSDAGRKKSAKFSTKRMELLLAPVRFPAPVAARICVALWLANSFFTSLWFVKVTLGINWKILQMLLSSFYTFLTTLHWRRTGLTWSLIHSNSLKAMLASYSDRGSSSDWVQIKRKEINSSITTRSKYRVLLRTRFY